MGILIGIIVMAVLAPILFSTMDNIHRIREQNILKRAKEYIKVGDTFKYYNPVGGNPFTSNIICIKIIDIKDSHVLYKYEEFYQVVEETGIIAKPISTFTPPTYSIHISGLYERLNSNKAVKCKINET